MESRFTTGSSRLDAVLSKLGRYTRAGGQYLARCPAHDDREASLSVGLGDDGKILLKCHAGCSFDAIRQALDIPTSELFADNDNGRSGVWERGAGNGGSNGKGQREERSSLTLAEFAAHKKLPPEALEFFGVRNGIRFGRACVEFEYRKRDGSLARTRQRIGLSGQRFTWKGDGGEIVAYEPDLGELARTQRYLVVVEGESDTLTLLFTGFPALGVPGADHTRVLRPEHFEGLERVFVVHEGGKGGDTFATKVPEVLREFGFGGAVHVLKLPGGAKDPSGLYVRDPAAFPSTFAQLLKDLAEPPPHRLESLWKTVGEWGLLDTEPPPQEWVLMRPDTETNGMGGPIGLLPLSEVGFLIAAGGVGKSFALIQLALAVATGRSWLDYFLVPKVGRVLILLGEEKLKQAHRRFHDLAASMRLTEEQRRLVKENIVMMPLSGVIAPFVTQDGVDTHETDVMAFLRKRLGEAEWRLLLIDPLSRFAGSDTEKDNAQATRFVQVAETLCQVPGSPTVLFAHHSNKVSRVEGAQPSSTADARGSTAIVDGGRWSANLTRRAGGVAIRFTKGNYNQEYEETIYLERAYGGYLRVQSDAAREAAEEKVDAALRPKILAALRATPGLSKKKLREACGGNDAKVRRVIDQLVAAGEVEESPKNAYRLRRDE